MSDEQRLVRDLARDLANAGLTGWFLARDLRTGEEVGAQADEPVPLASLIKLPLAIAILDQIHGGQLDGSAPLVLAPSDRNLPGGVGISRFTYPATVSVIDAVYLSVSLSDNVATDALFDLVPPSEVTDFVKRLGVENVVVRHRMDELSRTPAEVLPDDPDLAHVLAAAGSTAGGGHRVSQLDATRASSGSARSLVDLMEVLWTPGDRLEEGVAAHARWLLSHNVHRQRLWPDLASDSATWSSKTGTVLNLRHEAGVLEYSDGERYALVVLTESKVAASVQPSAEATMGYIARRLRDHLRGLS